MIFSHISDTHLGLVQYGSEEREHDVYDSFNQAIDTSISDHVDFVIFAGDIFHVPNPNGNAILQMANALRRLKEKNIESFFILGEHDISRIRSTPISYVYHNLGFSRYIGNGKPVEFNDVLLVGLDKIRKSEMPSFEQKFSELDSLAKKHKGPKILVMHQGITEFNKFAGELLSTDLPKNFSYYAMGHLHDKDIREFSQLSGPIAYPGSTELTTSEGIKETKKGFFEVDISGADAKPNWIELKTRPQFSYKIDYENLESAIGEISQKLEGFSKKPIVELKIKGQKIESDRIQGQISRLNSQCLRYFWKILSEDVDNSSVLSEKPGIIDDELFRLSVNALGSEQLATFAVRKLLPVLESGNTKEAMQIVLENFAAYKKEKLK